MIDILDENTNAQKEPSQKPIHFLLIPLLLSLPFVLVPFVIFMGVNVMTLMFIAVMSYLLLSTISTIYSASKYKNIDLVALLVLLTTNSTYFVAVFRAYRLAGDVLFVMTTIILLASSFIALAYKAKKQQKYDKFNFVIIVFFTGLFLYIIKETKPF